jgi:signal transduction histidine kinase
MAPVRTKVLSIIVLQLGLSAAIGWLVRQAGAPLGAPVVVLAFVAAFAAVSTFSVRLEFRSQQVTFTLAEAVFAVSLFVVGPVGAAVAGGIGELIVWLLRPVRPLKVAFNVSNQLCAMVVGGTVFWLFHAGSPEHVGGWLAALAATLCYSLFNLAGLAGVLSATEGRRFPTIFLQFALTGSAVALTSGPLGLIGLTLFRHDPFAPLLLAPLCVAVAFNNRHATAQRDEHLRFERLYGAGFRTARLVSFDDAVTAVATEAQALLTGSGAICISESATGGWIAVQVDASGARPAEPSLVRGLLAIAYGRDCTEIAVDALPPEVRVQLVGAATITLASSSDGSPAPVVLGVLRTPVSGEDTPESRIQTLSAFMTHATMAVGNARLLGEVEEALRQQVDLNRQKGDFVAAVSHELRTPLTAMLGSVGTMMRLEERLDADGRHKMLVMAKDQGMRLKRLIEELLTVAAAEHAGMDVRHELVDVRRLLVDVRTNLQSTTAARVVVESDTVEGVVSDRLKLQQILLNLVENAGKYAPDGPIEVVVAESGGRTTFAVRDHGAGIPVADRGRVFERFVQLDQSSTRRNGGTGLGLYLCRQLAEALGGRLDLGDAEGSGCVFTVTLPTGDVTAARAAAAMRQAAPGRVVKESIAMSRPLEGARG